MAQPSTTPPAGMVRRLARPGLLVFVLALSARLSVPVLTAGFSGFFGHDPATYYADAVALTYGKLPYVDYALVHPPLIAFALQPAAWLGRLTNDHVGFVAGNVSFMVLGALNAALVVAVARRLRLGPVAAVSGGVAYAVWLGSVGAEFGSRLEPLGNTLLLLGLLALARARSLDRTWLWCLAGGLLGLTMSVKIWWALPVVFLIAWVAVIDRRPARAAWMVAGSAASGLVVDGPLLLASRGRMWEYVVTSQLTRRRVDIGLVRRLPALTGVDRLSGAGAVLALGLALVMAACVVAAWQQPPVRPLVVLLPLQAVVLLASPSYFHFYDDYLAVAACLTVAAAVETLHARTRVARRRPTVRAALTWALVAGVAAAPVLQVSPGVVAVTVIRHQHAFAAAAARVPCIVSQSAMDLIMMNALSRSFEPGCHDVVDPFGMTLVERAEGLSPARVAADRNRYLESGDAVAIIPRAVRLLPGLSQDLAGHPVLARSPDLMLIRTGHS